MYSAKKCLCVLALLSMASLMVDCTRIKMVDQNEVSDVSVSRSRRYHNVDRLISSLSRQVKNELRSLDRRINNTNKQKTIHTNNLRNMAKHISRVRQHLRIAQRNYNHFTRLRSQRYQDLRKLQHSLRIKSHYIKMERKYINILTRESVKFRHYPKEYRQLRKELTDLRRQVGRELNDLRRAYNRLYHKMRAQRTAYDRRRGGERRKINKHRRNYNRSMGRYHQMRRIYKKTMRSLENRLKHDKNLRVTLREELSMLHELDKLLDNYKPGRNSGLAKQYEKCKVDRVILQKRLTNCTYS